MKLVVALGGNALLRRGQALSAENQLENIRRAAVQLARVALAHDMVLTHGNGPQVGLLLLQSAAYKPVQPYPLDVLGAETEGMIGYQLEQELANLLPAHHTVVTLLTRTEVDASDPAFAHPTKPVGPMYTQVEAQRLATDRGWTVAADGNGFRRVVASPKPLRVLGIEPMAWLLEKGALVIAAGGGGIPVVRSDGGANHAMRGIEDCYTLNPKAPKSMVFAGWKDMDEYMREHKLEGTPSVFTQKPDAPAKARPDEDIETEYARPRS